MKFKVSILNFLMLAALSFVPLHIAYSQTASILPPAKTTYLDKNGKPLAFGTVDFYIPGTTTPKTTWQDAGQTTPNTNPVVLDNAGRSIVLGDGAYRQIVRDKNGNLIWDQVTSSTGSGGGGGGGTPTVGDGDVVGTIKAYSGFIAPNQYVFAYGQEFTRASYPEALAALTSQQNINCSSGSPTLTGLSSTEQLSIGSDIETSCLNSGATIISKTTSTVTASSNAVISTSTSARFFPYGNGNGSTTFNLPDLRGRIVAGRDNMGGIASNRIPSVYSSLGGSGGNANVTLSTANLPPYSPSGSITNGAITTNITGSPVVGSISAGVQGGSTYPNSVVNLGVIGATSTQAASTFSGNAQGGSSTPFSVIQPTQSYNYIIKVLPDTNPNSYFGVASIGGMYGVINCGIGLTCAGNTISSVNSLTPPPTPTTLGGVFESTSNDAYHFINGVDASGNLTYAAIPFASVSSVGGILQSSAPANQFAVGINSTGNILYSGGATTVNGQSCVIGGSCTVTASAGAITVNSTTVTGGATNGLLYKNSSGTLGSAITANNSLVVTDSSGVPSITNTLPYANIGNNSVDNTKIAQMAAATIKGNPTSSAANAQDLAIQSLANLAAPNTTLDYIPIYDHITGTIKNVTPGAIAASAVAGVTSFNSKTGIVAASASDRRIYVSTAGNDSNNGLSPETAKLTLQAGIDAANPGGIVNVGAGNYILTATLNMRPSVTLQCVTGSYISQGAGTNLAIFIDFNTYSADYASVIGCFIDGNRSANTDNSYTKIISSGTQYNIIIKNNRISDTNGYGIYVSAVNGIIDSNLLYNGHLGPIVLDHAYGMTVSNNRINGPWSGGIGVFYSNSNNIVNNILNGYPNLGIYSPLNVNTSGNTVTWVSGSTFTDVMPGQFVVLNGGMEFQITSKPSSTSLIVSPSLPTLSNVRALVGNGDGIGIQNSSYNVINNNLVSSLISFCMGTSSSDTDTSYNIFSNNYLSSCGKNAINISRGFPGTSHVIGNVISGNYIINTSVNNAAVGTLDKIAIYVGDGTPQIYDTRVIGNNIISTSYSDFAQYWLYLPTGNLDGSTIVNGNTTGGIPNGNVINNDITSVTLSSQFGSTAFADNFSSTGDAIRFTIHSSGTGQTTLGAVTIHKKSDTSATPTPHAVITSSTNSVLYSLPFGGEATESQGSWTTTYIGAMTAGDAMAILMK